MKAMVIERYSEQLQLRDLPDLEPGPQDVVVRVRSNGICATDLKMIDGLVSTVTLPRILGHETAGEVTSLGHEVRGLSIGDHVTVYPTHGCGYCDACRTGFENHCLDAPRTGFEIDGGYSQYLVTRGRNAIKIDSNVPFEEASVLPDAVAAPYHGLVQQARVIGGETVVVVGVGGLGIHAVQIALIMGARVIAVDVTEDKLKAAEEFGAESVLAGGDDSPSSQVKALTDGKGADIVVECVGGEGVSGILDDCIKCLKLGGRLVVLGYAYGQPLSVDSAELIYGQWSILGSRASTLQDVVEVVKLTESGRLKPVVTQRFPLEKANEALDMLRNSSPLGRIVLTS